MKTCPSCKHPGISEFGMNNGNCNFCGGPPDRAYILTPEGQRMADIIYEIFRGERKADG